MATRVIRLATRKRGFFGWLFFLIFIAFNALMVAWLIAAIAIVPQPSSAVAAIADSVGFGTILFVWVVGAVFTGAFALLTRSRPTIVEEHVD